MGEYRRVLGVLALLGVLAPVYALPVLYWTGRLPEDWFLSPYYPVYIASSVSVLVDSLLVNRREGGAFRLAAACVGVYAYFLFSARVTHLIIGAESFLYFFVYSPVVFSSPFFRILSLFFPVYYVACRVRSEEDSGEDREAPESGFPSGAVSLSTTFDDEDGAVRVSVESDGGTEVLEVLVNGEVRRTLRNPQAGDEVTVEASAVDEVSVRTSKSQSFI